MLHSMSRVAVLFRTNPIDGAALMGLTHSELVNELGLSNLQAKRVEQHRFQLSSAESEDVVKRLESEIQLLQAENKQLKIQTQDWHPAPSAPTESFASAAPIEAKTPIAPLQPRAVQATPVQPPTVQTIPVQSITTSSAPVQPPTVQATPVQPMPQPVLVTPCYYGRHSRKREKRLRKHG